ncbi:RNA-binding protein MEX3B-like isoform X2 [Paramormyrops kingsleyae]|uniref:Mex-3 RNA binding family member D n=2 Tax=Paramormyrops kingsleyae TaxID=1676925 RepID=A0A3B3SIW3_9TELE|nr:RNA-binding protein MEX3B-like isoform X2 [Paramormyrops kingsleyae]XP_023653988.1 RNA-binding protein MEX3B-like isoform X2 [Paramormyrops kingsleyae]
MPSPIFHPEFMDREMLVSGQRAGLSLTGEIELEPADEQHQEALRIAFDQLSLMEKANCGVGGLGDSLDAAGSVSEVCNNVGGGYVGLAILEPADGGSLGSPTSCSPSPEYYGPGGYHMAGSHSQPMEPNCSRKRSVNMTECVPVPSSEHVAEIVGRQGCKIKALRAKTNTYIKTPVRGEPPVFIVTGRREDVEMAKCEILSAAEHFSMIRASRCKAGSPGAGGTLSGPPNLPGQITIQVRVPYRVVGLVVGPKGATIKRIQQQTQTYIVTPSREKDPVFEVTGMPENVERAREEIETHITLRTGAFINLQGDTDFHSNGTDVSLEGLGSLGLGAPLWSKSRHLPTSAAALRHSGRKAARGSFHNGLSPEHSDGPRGVPEPGCPTSPFCAGSKFSFNGESNGALVSQTAEELGFEFGSANIWAPLASGPQQRRDSGALSVDAATPCLSPTLPCDSAPPEQPLARRAQSDPLGTLSWLQAGGVSTCFSAASSSSGGSTTGYSSCSGGSPTDSEGGVTAPGPLGQSRGRAVVAGAPGRHCCVCFESEVTAALVPCGHNLFCMDCAGQICQSSNPECPECQSPVTQCMRIFS